MNRRGRNNTHQQCASCKYQNRIRCGRHCKLAPYFPMSRFEEYVAAHQLFGIQNINKIMNIADQDDKATAAESILQEGYAWAMDPVRGAFGIIRDLLEEIETHEKELEDVKKQLEKYRKGGEDREAAGPAVDALALPMEDKPTPEEAENVKPSDVDRMINSLQEDLPPKNTSTTGLEESSTAKKPLPWNLNEPYDNQFESGSEGDRSSK